MVLTRYGREVRNVSTFTFIISTTLLLKWYITARRVCLGALFEDTNVTRPDIKVFLSHIGNLTVYICICTLFIFSVLTWCSWQSGFHWQTVSLSTSARARKSVHLEKSSSASFTFLVIFVWCSLRYNLRKRGGDSADKYVKSTEVIAGVKDMHFQALMPGVLYWLGIEKVDKWSRWAMWSMLMRS